MLIVVLDYTDGSVHFHKIPDTAELLEMYDDYEDPIEEYLTDTLEYSSNIHWMEVRC